jgi:hypothetical protein
MIEKDPSRRPTAEEGIAVLKSIPSDPGSWFGPSALTSSDETKPTTPPTNAGPKNKTRHLAILAGVAVGALGGAASVQWMGRQGPEAMPAARPAVVATMVAVARAMPSPPPPTAAPEAVAAATASKTLEERTLPPAEATMPAAAAAPPRKAALRLPGVEAWAISGDIIIDNTGEEAFALVGAILTSGSQTYRWSKRTEFGPGERWVLWHGSWVPQLPESLPEGSRIALRAQHKGVEGTVSLPVQE